MIKRGEDDFSGVIKCFFINMKPFGVYWNRRANSQNQGSWEIALN